MLLFIIYFLVPPFIRIACFNTANNLLTDTLGDFRNMVKQNKAAEVIAKCSELAIAKGYKFFALGYSGKCRSGPKARDEYHAKPSTKDSKCPNGIGSGNRIAVYTFGESSNISNTRKRVSYDFKTSNIGLKIRGAAEFFLTNFGVWKSDETFFRVFEIAFQLIVILREIQSKSSTNVMIIKITISKPPSR